MKATWIVVLVAFLSTRALGAYVLFEPAGYYDIRGPGIWDTEGGSVSVDITVVGETLTQMQGIDLVLFWDEDALYSWSYSPESRSAFTTLSHPRLEWCGFVSCDSILIGGNRLVGSVPANLMLGTLTLEARSYHTQTRLVVGGDDFGLSNVLLGAQSDPIRTTELTINFFVPEPGTLALFSLAAWAVVGRRQRHSNSESE